MAASGDSVVDLRKKINALAEAMCDRKNIKRATLPELARFAGISTPTLKSACATGKMTKELAQSLFVACGLSTGNNAWIDRNYSDDERRRATGNYQGNDTAHSFRRYVRQALKLTTDVHYALQSLQPRTLDTHVASIAISDTGQTTTYDQAIQVLLEVDVSPSHDESGLVYGFKKVRVRLMLPPDTTASIKNGLGSDSPVKMANAELVMRGTRFEPIWELSTGSGILNGNYATKENALFHLFDGNVGLTFEVELSAQLYDGSLAASDGTPVEPSNRSRIVEFLMSKRICEKPVDHGWLPLGRQKLRIIRSER